MMHFTLDKITRVCDPDKLQGFGIAGLQDRWLQRQNYKEEINLASPSPTILIKKVREHGDQFRYGLRPAAPGFNTTREKTALKEATGKSPSPRQQPIFRESLLLLISSPRPTRLAGSESARSSVFKKGAAHW